MSPQLSGLERKAVNFRVVGSNPTGDFMDQITIQKHYKYSPRTHVGRVRVLVNGVVAIDINGTGCEFVSQVEAQAEIAENTARGIAKVLNCLVIEECVV